MGQLNISKVVLNLIFLNVGIFVLQYVIPGFRELLPLYEPGLPWLPAKYVMPDFKPYQVVTYFFAHGGPMHILFNMYALASLGTQVEMVFGEKRFLAFYLFCGVFAGVALALLDPSRGVVVGASGAVSGVFTAYAIYYPNQRLSLMFIPIQFKARDLAIGIAAISGLLVLLSLKYPGAGGGISHFGHLAGMAAGWLFLKFEGLVGRIRK